MKLWPPLLCIGVSLCTACGESHSNEEDAGPLDAQSSDSRPDAGVDGATDDASPDGPDGGSDAVSDAGSDGGSDAGSDAVSDAGSDGGSDAGSDGGSDAGSDGGSDAVSDAGPDGGDDGPLPAGSAVFSIVESGVSHRYEWSVGRGNHVRCTVESPMSLIRLAISATRDGEDDLHMDFDVCRLSTDGGVVEGRDPFTTSCDATPYFHVWWHQEHGQGVFVNNASSSPCTLTLVRDSDVLQGRFRCDRLALPYVLEPTVDVEGAFACPTAP